MAAKMTEQVTKSDLQELEHKIAYLTNRIVGLDMVMIPLLTRSVAGHDAEGTKQQIDELAKFIEDTKKQMLESGDLEKYFTEGLFEAADKAVRVLNNYKNFINVEQQKESGSNE